MKKVLKILFKSTASTDYSFPYFYVKNKEDNYKIDFLVWDFSPQHLIKKLPNKKYLPYEILTFWDFLKVKLNFHNLLDKTFYLKRLYFALLKKNPRLLNKEKLKNFFLYYDKIYMDCRELETLPYCKDFCNILTSINKTITFVPHSPYYTNPIRETSDSHSLYFKNCKKKLIICTKESMPWKDTGGFIEKECYYIGLPANNDKWISFYNSSIKKNLDEKTVGFIFRPFDRNFNKFFIKFRMGDDYINSYDDNISFINIAQKLYDKGYKITFRLHPSSKEDAFEKFYYSSLKNLKFKFSNNTIHEFFSENKNIVAFNSSGLIYGCIYKNKIFLRVNDLSTKIWDEWKIIKDIFDKFCIPFHNDNQFFDKFNDKTFEKKYDFKNVLKLLW